jgi:hypothetical protein
VKNRFAKCFGNAGIIGAMLAVAVVLTAIPALRASDVVVPDVLTTAPVMSSTTDLAFDDQPTQGIFRFSMFGTTEPSTQPQQDHSLLPFFAEEARNRSAGVRRATA